VLTLSRQKHIRDQLNKKLRVYYLFCQAIGMIAFVFLLPALLLITAIISFELFLAEGRWRLPFFVEVRFTQGRTFTLYKFLSSSENGKHLSFGTLLKLIYLDELPQIYSIAMGDMVFVGPRPNPDYEYYRIRDLGFYAKVLQKAGLTGGVQTAKGSDQHGNLSLDEDYMYFCLNHNLPQIITKDLQTIWKTMVLMKKAEGI